MGRIFYYLLFAGLLLSVGGIIYLMNYPIDPVLANRIVIRVLLMMAVCFSIVLTVTGIVELESTMRGYRSNRKEVRYVADEE